MLSDKEIEEIKEHLERAQNPLFFFDNDADGLCSFLLLRRAIERGRGVAIKSFPDLNATYARKIQELNPDYVFILDKPIVSEGFLKETEKMNLPVIWIDHHEVEFPNLSEYNTVHYYNSMKNNKPSSEPTTYWCYKIARKREDLWLALCGCVGDGFLPDFAKEAEKLYPELWRQVDSAFHGLYETGLGKITRILNFALKDRTSNVVKMIRFMFKAKPEDVLHEDKRNTLLIRFEQVEGKYQKLIESAMSHIENGKLLYFQYGGELSISADIANELFYRNPGKIIVVAYLKGTKANISIRGKDDVRALTLRALEGIEGARGGGHKNATGAQMNVEDLPRFKERIENLIK